MGNSTGQVQRGRGDREAQRSPGRYVLEMQIPISRNEGTWQAQPSSQHRTQR
jgi:hypothetical protein